MASTEAIASTTAAGYSAAIALDLGDSISVWVDEPLRAGEFVAVEQSADDGSSWIPLNDGEYQGRVLEYNRCRCSLSGPGTFRLAKSFTETATTVYYD